MSVRPLIAVYLSILCAVTTGCGPSAEPKADPRSFAAARNAAENREAAEEQAAEKRAAEKRAAEKGAAEEKAAQKKADDKKAADKKAADNSYVKVKVEVQLRGVLTYTDEAVTLSVVTPEFGTDQFKEVKWVLDFGDEKEIRAKAKSLDGKTVLVTGSAILRGIQSETKEDRASKVLGGPGVAVESFLDVEPKVAVKSLVAATKE